MTEPDTEKHERFGFPDPDSLLHKIQELGLNLPFSKDIQVLFSPIEIAGKKVPNRFAIHPMEGADGDRKGAPGPLTFRRYQRFAAGGSGLIWFEATTVKREHRSNPKQLCLCQENLGAFKRLVKEVRSQAKESMGANHEILLILQLTHPGRYCKPQGIPKPVKAQHNPFLDTSQGTTEAGSLITDEDLDHLQDEFVLAASLAAQAGFDGVDVKACHGYLVSELLAAHTREDSRYGGSFENRIRFLIEVLEGIQERVPGVFATTRINAYDGIPHPYGFGTDPENPGLEDLREPLALVKKLKDTGCPLINVSVGIPYVNPHLGRPHDVPLAGQKVPKEHPLFGVARFMRITGMLQQETPDLPMVGTGYTWLRHYLPHVGAALVQAKKAAFMGVGRCAFAYPDFVKDLKEKGRMDPDKTCITCSRCSQIMRDGESAGCVVKDKEIYLPIYQEGRKQKSKGQGS